MIWTQNSPNYPFEGFVEDGWQQKFEFGDSLWAGDINIFHFM